MASQPTTDLETLNKTLQAILPNAMGNGGLPPVESWEPANTTDIGMEIRKDGSWWHQGTRFTREKLVALFARILRKDEDGSTYLVTPYEKVIVHVEDAPFLGVRIDCAEDAGEQVILVTTNLGETVELNSENPLRVEKDANTGEPSPYVRIRGRLEAKLTRAAFIDLAGFAETRNDGYIISSRSTHFSL